MRSLIKQILQEETSSPEIMNTSIEEDIHEQNIEFIKYLINSRILHPICYMDVIYDGYDGEYRVELTIKGGITTWYSTDMSSVLSDIEEQVKEIKGIDLNLYMPRFIDNCGELDPGIQRL